MLLQTLQETAVAWLHGWTDPLHIFDAGKPIPLGFRPTYQPLPYDLLAGRVQSFHALPDTMSAVFS